MSVFIDILVVPAEGSYTIPASLGGRFICFTSPCHRSLKWRSVCVWITFRLVSSLCVNETNFKAPALQSLVPPQTVCAQFCINASSYKRALDSFMVFWSLLCLLEGLFTQYLQLLACCQSVWQHGCCGLGTWNRQSRSHSLSHMRSLMLLVRTLCLEVGGGWCCPRVCHTCLSYHNKTP